MAGKNVTSKDPRKPGIVSALKALSRGNKVTMVKEVSPGVFEAHCLGPKNVRLNGRGYSKFSSLGYYRVQEVKNEAGVTTHYVSATDIVTVPPNLEIALGLAKVEREAAKFFGEHVVFVNVGEG
jgi:hypothetical protein